MQATSLVGEYAVAGKNEHGDLYEGKATISSRGSGRYLVSWDLGDEELLIHEAYVKGNNLHVDFYAAVYAIRNDGILEGKWGAAGGYETLTPYLLVRAGSTGQASGESGQLDGELIGALHFALLDAFTPDTMRQMTRIYLDQALENIAGGSDFSGVTFNLIAWAERNGRLLELLNAAIAAVPGNARLKDCAASLRAYLA
jgi:hypothetical protein